MIYNQSYAETRVMEGYEGFEDILEVEEDYNNVLKGWRQFQGYRVLDVKSKSNASRDFMSELFSNLRQEMLNNSTAGEKTLLFFYYAGHGVMKNLVFSVNSD